MKAWKWLVALWMTAVILAAFLYAREAKGFVPGSGQIIFFHVPMAMSAFVGFLFAMIYAVRYLATRDPFLDAKSETAAELGLLFCVLATLTGSLFARIMWNSFWHWDPKETSILILLFIYGAYFGLRLAVEDPERRAALAAVYAILAFVAVPFFMWIAPRMPALIGAESSLHPTDTLTKREGLSSDYRIVLYSSFLGFCGLFAWLFDLQVRVRQIALRRDAWHGDTAADAGTAVEVPAGTPLKTGGA
jgi:heme exporter protein C